MPSSNILRVRFKLGRVPCLWTRGIILSLEFNATVTLKSVGIMYWKADSLHKFKSLFAELPYKI